mmetsp:Transcript_508/g.1544  ORF Transcript_508/g.1544 Transcript_508/m.1544 type:complete len:373 (+) Transcript_508:231-1349(+)|eukprot:CAMPEP_0117664566 /NCGR_PEP_ID=MMETSP0804-20121206/9297_1 /TAXON_ID=1074897 /ORGANISM="Tetraselmis astigmatica, Strain CCMP880" /LENGTH=372 /DNA_ID=CAMNT_0005471825 /DNA_START=204 /DNA_END=1322 /DNA_ORIENTATION=-
MAAGDGDDLQQFIAAVQQAEVDARTCHEDSERRRAQLHASLGAEEKPGPPGRFLAPAHTYSSDDGASLQNGCGSHASSVDPDPQLRAAQLREKQQFQNLREKRAALEEKLQKLSISLRGDGRIAKRARYQLTQKVWHWLNSAFLPSIGVHLGPDHIDAMSEDRPTTSGDAELSGGRLDFNHGSGSFGEAGPSSMARDTEGTFNDTESRGTHLSAGLDCLESQGGSTDLKGPVAPSANTVASKADPETQIALRKGPPGPNESPQAPALTETPAGPSLRVANGESENGRAKRKAPLTAEQQWEPSWLAQAEAAQAVLASSHEALSSHKGSMSGPQADLRVASSSDLAPQSGFLSGALGSNFTLGHGNEAPDELS